MKNKNKTFSRRIYYKKFLGISYCKGAVPKHSSFLALYLIVLWYMPCFLIYKIWTKIVYCLYFGATVNGFAESQISYPVFYTLFNNVDKPPLRMLFFFRVPRKDLCPCPKEVINLLQSYHDAIKFSTLPPPSSHSLPYANSTRHCRHKDT